MSEKVDPRNSPFFRGYVITNGKKAITKYKDPANQFPLEDVQGARSYAGILSDDAILVDIDNEEEANKLLEIIKKEEIKCEVRKTTHGIHVFFLGHHLTSTKTKYANAIGLDTDYKLGNHSGLACLKLDGVPREIVYKTDSVQELPCWLYPVSKEVPKFLTMGEGDGRNDSLYKYILTLQRAGLTKDETRETLKIINRYVLKNPLSDRELSTIFRDDAFPTESFYDLKGRLQVRAFEEHFCREAHIIKLDGNLHVFCNGVYVNGDSMIRGEMLKYLPDLTLAQRNEILNRSKDRIQNNSKRSSAYLIAFRNGVYDITTGTLEKHTADNVITNLIDWNYNATAYSQIADNTLNKLSCNDPDIRKLLEEIIGYCFFRRNELGKAFILLGDKSNGKSTYLDLVRFILGENNTSSLALQELGSRFKTGELFNKLANIGDDIPDTWVPDPSIFKKVVTGDRLSAEYKGTNPFEFCPYAKMLLSANDMPRIDDKTGAVKRRLIPVPFKAVFSPNDPDYDPYIKHKLRTEEAVEYLIKVGIEGLKRVLENDSFTTNATIEAELQNIDYTNNPILQFIDDTGTDAIINHSTAEVYDAYKSYCIVGNYQPVSKNSFIKQINTRLGTETIRKMIKGDSNKIFQIKST